MLHRPARRKGTAMGRVLSSATLIALLVGLVARPDTAAACSPTATAEEEPSRTAFTVEARAKSSMVIFEGTIVGHENGQVYGPAIVKVVRYLKGVGPGLVMVVGFGSGEDCLPVVMPAAKLGASGLFYTSGDPYQRLYLSPDSAIEPARPELQAIIASVVGHDPVAPSGTHPILAQSDWSTMTPEPYSPSTCCGSTCCNNRDLATVEVAEVRGSTPILWLGMAGTAFVLGLGLALWAALRGRRAS
jgi:hypothetical protein